MKRYLAILLLIVIVLQADGRAKVASKAVEETLDPF